jgi:hypothetical protein
MLKRISSVLSWMKVPAALREFATAVWDDWAARMSGVFSVPITTVAALFSNSASAQAFWLILAASALLNCAYRVWAVEHVRANTLAEQMRPKVDLVFKPEQPWITTIPRARIYTAPGQFIETTSLFFHVQVSNRSPYTLAPGVRVELTNVEREENDTFVGRGFGTSLPLRWSKGIRSGFDPRDIPRLAPYLIDVVSVDAYSNKVVIKAEEQWQSDEHLFDAPGTYRLTLAAIPAEGEGTVVRLLLKWTGQWDQTTMWMDGAEAKA